MGDEVAVGVVQSYDTGLVHTITGSSSLIVGQVDFFQFYLVLILRTTEVSMDGVDTTTILVAGYVTVSVVGEVVNNHTILESVQASYGVTDVEVDGTLFQKGQGHHILNTGDTVVEGGDVRHRVTVVVPWLQKHFAV